MFRIGFMGHFAQVARSHHRRLMEVRSRLPPGSDAPPDSDEYLEYLAAAGPIEGEMAEAASIVIVFAVIAAEAYIYDFAARHLGDTYVERHLDKLNLQSKWVVVPKLVKGYSLPSDGQAFQALVELTRDRNEIVHSKTRKMPVWGTDSANKLIMHAVSLDARADQAIRALDTLRGECQKFDPSGSDFFGTGDENAG
jgi:hypothetical protein